MTHNHLYAATMFDIPMNHSIAAKILHHWLALERVRRIAIMNPKAMLETPMVRTKKTRGLLPLQIVNAGY
jgi:hypothetical protein